MGIRSRSAAAALAIAGAFVAQPALAEGTCPAPDDAPLVGAVDPQARLDFLSKAFDEEVRETDEWSWTLGTVFTAAGVAQAAVLPIYKHDRATSIDLTVGAIGFGIGAVSLWFVPLQITVPLNRARRHLNDPDRCAALANAERTLVAVAKEEARETGITPHIANVLVNTAAILILGLGYGHGQQATFGGGIGFALGEANAFSQPHNLRRVLLQYRSGELDQASPAPKLAWSIVPMTTPQTAGAGVALSW
jgi:hypothetical protein